ncbi:MAG: hypothetical protein U0230_16780 [Polyangiales bacterium]
MGFDTATCGTRRTIAIATMLALSCGLTALAQPRGRSTRPARGSARGAAAASPNGIPPHEAPPRDAPSLPGAGFPNFGTLRAGAKAYFPTMATAEKLSAGTLDQAGMSWFRGEIVSLDPATATATVRDLQRHEYAVPYAYVLQAREPVQSVRVGEVYLGERFNRAELVLVTNATPDARGEIATLGLAGFMPDSVRPGTEALDELVPVSPGGIGSIAVCRGPNGVRGYTVLRRAPEKVLGFDGTFVRVLPETACRFAPPVPTLATGQDIVYVYATAYREARVEAVDATTGAVRVSYPWGSERREDTARFGSIASELPPEPGQAPSAPVRP